MKENNNKVITGKVRFSYANVWEPKTSDDGEKKYSISLIIPKDDKTTIRDIKKAIENAKKAGIAKFNGKVPTTLKIPLRDGDEERENDENYINSYFVNATGKIKPGIIDKYGRPITDPADFYSGCYGRASITFYAFNSNGNKGIACGLNNLMKLEDGEPLSGISKAEDDFAEFIETENNEFLQDNLNNIKSDEIDEDDDDFLD